MANELLNSTFLDGASDWIASGDVTVLSSGWGSKGRLALSGTNFVQSSVRPLNGRSKVWVAGHFTGTRLVVRFATPDGELDTTLPILRSGSGQPSRGRPDGFNYSAGWVDAPPGATGFSIFTDGKPTVHLTKPYASADGLKPCVWQAGPHSNQDLNYPSWPSHLPPIMDEGLQFDPIPTRKGFSGDAGVEATRRITRTRRYIMTAQVGLTTGERDDLMDFFDANPGKFWFTRPDTREVCLAQWLSDGEPVDGGQLPGRRRTQFKLQLVVP